MLNANSLRIDRGDGSAIIDYRIQDGRVETRIVETADSGSESNWRSVTPEELSSHVMSNTMVAQWLRRKMGIHSLLRACNAEQLSAPTTEYSSQIAA